MYVEGLHMRSQYGNMISCNISCVAPGVTIFWIYFKFMRHQLGATTAQSILTTYMSKNATWKKGRNRALEFCAEGLQRAKILSQDFTLGTYLVHVSEILKRAYVVEQRLSVASLSRETHSPNPLPMIMTCSST